MTNNDLRAMAEVLIAAADGKPIEFQEESQQSWHNLKNVHQAIWNFSKYTYRIKPDPIRECLDALREQLTDTKFLDELEKLMYPRSEK